jgi:bifunctional DNA-binding transcriptional regulator/antitoxin component of YhaV-PrlF toxin-antitoxin module
MKVVLSTRGRFTVPVSVRHKLKLKPGDFENIEMIGRRKVAISRVGARRKAPR